MPDPRSLIESVKDGADPVSVVNEVAVSQDGGTTRMTTDQQGQVKAIVEKHFMAMGAEIEMLGVKFNAHVNNGYAGIDW